MKKLTTLLCIALCIVSTLNAQNKPTGVFLNLYAYDMAQPKGISENGMWACGSAFWSGNENQAGTINASKWNLETGERTFLVGEDDMSDAFAISNDGTLVCGSYMNQPAYWLESDGLWHVLDLPRGASGAGDVYAMTIVGKDTIMAGFIYESTTKGQIVRWINGKVDNNFKYRNYTRYKEITGDEIAGEMQLLRGMSTDGERYLISLDHNLLPSVGTHNLPTTFVQFGTDENYTTQVIEREFGIYDLVSFVEDATMSFNGKYVCGRIYGVPRDGVDAAETPAIAFSYDVDNDKLTDYGYIEATGRYVGASCVDNQGHVYFKSITGYDPLGKPYIYKNNEFIELEQCLLAYDGITAEQIDAIAEEVEGSDADDLGIVWCVSADGKTLIGAGDALKGNIWCAKLSCSPYDVFDIETNTEDLTYNSITANYADGIITLSSNADMIDVYSITGAKVMSQVVENNSIKANLRNGIYVVKIYNGNDIATSKIIVK